MDGPYWGSVTSKNFLIDSKTEIWKGQQKVSEAAVNSSSDHATSHSQHGASENIYIYFFQKETAICYFVTCLKI